MPFRFVESKGFKRFIEETITFLESKFIFLSSTTSTIAKDALAIYHKKKQALKVLFVGQGYRISLTIDTWTSCQNLTIWSIAHFIDNSWKMHKRIINFFQIHNHKGGAIGREVESCLKHWEIEKVLTLTIDNDSSNDSVVAYLVKHFKWGLSLDEDFLQVRCCALIILIF